MDDIAPDRSGKRIIEVTALAWVAAIGLDFLLGAGVLAGFFAAEFRNPCLLSPLKAFQNIPLGYAAFLIWCGVVAWLLVRTRVTGARNGAVMGAGLGLALAGAGALAMASMLSLSTAFLLVWTLIQTAQFCLAGAVIGSGLAAVSLRPLVYRVLALFVACLAAAVLMQNLGLAPMPQVR